MPLMLSSMVWKISLQGLTRGIQALKHLPRLAVLLLNENELKAGTMRAVANLTSLTVRSAPTLGVPASWYTHCCLSQHTSSLRLHTLDVRFLTVCNGVQ